MSFFSQLKTSNTMKIKRIYIENFRGFSGSNWIDIDENLTTFVGKNDTGKSSVLEALEIFFHPKSKLVKFDESDKNIRSECDTVRIGVSFSDFPVDIDIDSGNITNLEKEYLLDDKGYLTFVRSFYPQQSSELWANYPEHEECKDLLKSKQSALKKKVTELGLDCDKNKNADMRLAIFEHYDVSNNLSLQFKSIDKELSDKLTTQFPNFFLFQSDRSNHDTDKEVQDPLAFAVQSILSDNDLKNLQKEMAEKVIERLKQVSEKSLEKLKEMNPELAKQLFPKLPDPEELKWPDVFKNVSIVDENNISLNKRGSGVRRLVLLNFFRAEAERQAAASNINQIVYAIEEPETAQHRSHQQKMMRALSDLSSNFQILLTTHSMKILKDSKVNGVRLIYKDFDGNTNTKLPAASVLPRISLNEIGYTMLEDPTVEYLDELYSLAIGEGKALPKDHEFFRDKKVDYNWLRKNGNVDTVQIPFSEKLRHMVHHPENQNNGTWNERDLIQAIEELREFIKFTTKQIVKA